VASVQFEHLTHDINFLLLEGGDIVDPTEITQIMQDWQTAERRLDQDETLEEFKFDFNFNLKKTKIKTTICHTRSGHQDPLAKQLCYSYSSSKNCLGSS
jgi:hypothetical protein